MSTGRYVLTVSQRLLLVVSVGLLAGLGAAAATLAGTPSYTSTVTYLVGPGATPPGASVGAVAALAGETLPSLVRVAESSEVRTGAEDDLGLAQGALSGRVTAEVVDRDLTLFEVSVTGPSARAAADAAEAVSTSLQASVASLTGADSVVLSVVTPPREPAFASSAGVRRNALLATALTGVTAAVLLGLAEGGRPRVRSRHDVGGTGRLTVVVPARWSRADVSSVDRLTERLSLSLPPVDARRVAEQVSGLPRRGATHRLPTPAGDVLVVRNGRSLLAEAAADTHPVVVLRAGRWARLCDAVGDRLRDVVGDGAERRPGTAALVPAAALFIAGLGPRLPGNLDAAALLALVLLPAWVGHLRRWSGAPLLLLLGAVALVNGVVLSLVAGVTHDVSSDRATAQVMFVLGGLGVVGLVCWARRVMPFWAVPVAFGLGMLVDAALTWSSSVNPVKFLLVFPLSVVVLALCDRWSLRWPAVAACGALAALCAVNDSRSSMAFLLATGGILLWQGRRSRRRPLNRLSTAAAVSAAGAAGYLLVTELLLAGTLGEALAERSRQQVDQSGSLLLGGRPELSGTLQLMADRPSGFGLGVVPTGGDVLTVKQGFAALRIPTADGYIENYLTAGGFELHSVAADLWVWLGVPGLLLGLLMGFLVARGLVDGLATSSTPAARLLLGLYALWFLAFGPVPSNMPEVALAVAICLLPARRTAPAGGGPQEARTPEWAGAR